MAELDLIAVGDVMVDVTVTAPALASGGDVHGRVRVRPGGTSANAAVWAAHRGARVRVHGRVGDDLPGRLLAAELARHGVDPVLAVDREAPTGTMLVVTEAGERSMVSDRGANARCSPGDLPFVLESTAALVSGYLLLHEPSMPAALAALERAAAEYVAVDAASWPLVEAFGADRFLRTTERASVLFANEREAASLTGLDDGEAAASALGERYRIACVKLGERGAVASWDGRLLRAGVEVVEAVDPTGAGDAFDGVLLAELAAGAAPEDALQAACAAGARVAAGPEPWPPEAAATDATTHASAARVSPSGPVAERSRHEDGAG